MERTAKANVTEKKDNSLNDHENARKKSEEIVGFLLNRYLRERENERKLGF
jgi:hypothetical protein